MGNYTQIEEEYNNKVNFEVNNYINNQKKTNQPID